MQRIEQQKIDDEKEFPETYLKLKQKLVATASRGTLPKGFEPKPEPEAPKVDLEVHYQKVSNLLTFSLLIFILNF